MRKIILFKILEKAIFNNEKVCIKLSKDDIFDYDIVEIEDLKLKKQWYFDNLDYFGRLKDDKSIMITDVNIGDAAIKARQKIKVKLKSDKIDKIKSIKTKNKTKKP